MYKLIKIFIFTTLGLALAMLSPSLLAKQKANKGYSHQETKNYSHQGKFQEFHQGKSQEFYHGTPRAFSSGDQRMIRNYFYNHPYQSSALPPGIAKNLERGKPLPPGIAKRYMPRDLTSSLNIYPGYEYFMVGDNVALVKEATGLIADIIPLGR